MNKDVLMYFMPKDTKARLEASPKFKSYTVDDLWSLMSKSEQKVTLRNNRKARKEYYNKLRAKRKKK